MKGFWWRARRSRGQLAEVLRGQPATQNLAILTTVSPDFLLDPDPASAVKIMAIHSSFSKKKLIQIAKKNCFRLKVTYISILNGEKNRIFSNL